MNILPLSKQAAILKALTEGASIRATARMVGVSKTTVLRLLVEAGELCAIYQHHKLRNLPCRRIQADEIWAFVGAKQRNAKRPGDGDIWTFTTMCADTKLMVSWLVGERSLDNTHTFMEDTASRLAHRVQLTTDGHFMYLTAVEDAFGWQGVDYSQLIKHYSADHGPGGRYSPPVCTGVERKTIMGHPDPSHVSTSFVERQNLTLRMQARRFTRLTNAFSKKVENHAHAVALHFMVYNFCRSHGTLTKAAKGVHTTPAMAAGVTDHVWTVEDLVGLLDPEKVLQ
ncbi:MAG: IS1 family transposase [Gemmatimonadales bacterium]